MIDLSREAFEAYCEANNIEIGRTVTAFEAWQKLAKASALYRFIRNDMYLNSDDACGQFAALGNCHGDEFDALIELEYKKHHAD